MQDYRWSSPGSDLLAKSCRLPMQRRRTSPGNLIPAQHAVSADVRRPARLSLADVSSSGLAQLGRANAKVADSARYAGRSGRQSETGQHSKAQHNSESPGSRRRWTLAGVRICSMRFQDVS